MSDSWVDDDVAFADDLRDDVQVCLTSGYSVFGETSIKYNNLHEGVPADWEFGKKFWALTEKLIAEGKLRPHEVQVRSGGLDGMMDGLRDLEKGAVKGCKLVYEV